MVMKRMLALMLAVLMLASVVACGKAEPAETTAATTGDAPSSTEAATTTAATEESPYDENGFLKDSLPADLNYNGQPISILYWNDVARPEFEVEQQTGELISDAIFLRNAAVEERLGLELQWTGIPGSYWVQEDFVKQAANDVHSGGEFDVFASYSMAAVTMTLQGLFRNLMEADHLNLEQPWWPQSLAENSTVNGKLYFCSGDISTNLLHQMFIMLFNKKLAEEYHLPDLYEVVNKGEWTIDKMTELAENAYADLNGNSTPDAADQFGISVRQHLVFDSFFISSNLHSIEKDASGTLKISDELTSEKAHNLVGKVISIFHESNYAAYPTVIEGWSNEGFADGRALFIIDLSNVTSSDEFADTAVTYGVLPTPKHDAAQEKHITCLEFGFTMYSASITVNDEKRDMIGAMLECMASESYRLVTPAVFETTMKLKYSSDSADSVMYDIIRNGISFDTGRIFCEPLDKLTFSAFREACNLATPNWASIMKAKGKIIQKRLDALIQTLDALPE
jgi:ABC-type glycerol-3-phosphate transport system substrate-binding protein